MSNLAPTKIMINNYTRVWNKTRHKNMDILMDETNPMRWWVRVRDIEGEKGEFIDGEYLFELTANGDPLHKPPTFKVMTPNGLYTPGTTSICISNGQYHSNNYAPGKGGMGGFCMQMVDIMISWRDLSQGIGFLQNAYYSNRTPQMERRICDELTTLAKASKAFNRQHYPDLIESFDNKGVNVAYRKIQEWSAQRPLQVWQAALDAF